MEPASQSFRDLVSARLADGGPRYVETPLVPELAQGIAEPYNAASALVFVLIAAVWAWRLRGRLAAQLFLAGCMALLLVGGVGGTLYHATRTSRLFFLLDVVPIFALALLVSLWLWLRSGVSVRGFVALAAAILGGHLAAYAALDAHAFVNASYLMLAGVVLAPLAVNLWRDDGRGAGWVAVALASFGAALFFRIADSWGPHPFFPMGTHWLWHLFGATATAALAEYVHAAGAPSSRARLADVYS